MIAATTGAAPGKGNAHDQVGIAGKTNYSETELYFPGPTPVKPAFPDMNFLPGRVLSILLTGRRYTHKDSWIELGHSRLSDSIWKLRRLGWPVRMVEEVVPTSDAGRTASIGVYWLESDVITEAGERGRQYVADCAKIKAERRTS